MNYISGAPGSYFNVIGRHFPANSTAEPSVNGHVSATVPVNSAGSYFFALTTGDSNEGTYYVTASVNPSATKQFILDTTEPVRPASSPATTFPVPARIAFNESLYLP